MHCFKYGILYYENLNFSDQPEVLVDKMPRNPIWALGFSERLDCPVDANPPVTQIIWTKNGMIINFGTSPLKQLQNGSLVVEQVTQADAGNYRCTAISSYGNGDSEIVQVEVKGMWKLKVCYVMSLWGFQDNCTCI